MTSITISAKEIRNIAAHVALLKAHIDESITIKVNDSSGIGQSVYIHLAGIEIDVTDYDSW